MEGHRILVVDDHEIIVSGVGNILQEEFQNVDIVSCTDPQNAISKIDTHIFDLYIVDLEFGKMNGFDLITEIKSQDINARIIVYTMHDEIWTVNRLLEAEVSAIVLKSGAKDNLLEAVRIVLDDGTYLCPRFTHLKENNRIYKDLLRKRRKKSNLTDMEVVVLKYIVKGYQSSEIAEKISRSIYDVNFHRKNILLKLDARNVADLVAKVILLRIVDVE